MSKDKDTYNSLAVDHTEAEERGNAHALSSAHTPLRKDAFDLSDDEKIEIIEGHFRQIMAALGLDVTDESLSGTPYRVAKMYVNEIFYGLKPETKPVVRKFSNKYNYQEMVVVKNINVTSFCEHHFLPFLGKAHVAYISSGKVIGLSKINRIVDYYSRRPQVQERLTSQIAGELQSSLDTEDVAVFIESEHLCVATRGIEDRESSTITTEFRGVFKSNQTRQQFIDYIRTETKM